MPKVRNDPEKYVKNASAAGAYYAKGIASPRRPWHEATAAAAQAWTDGVQQAISQGSFAKAATPAASQTWQQQATTLGQQRYGPGVTASKDKYARGFEPYRQVIESITLPPRGRRGDPANYIRSQTIGQALNDKKNQMKGS